MIPRIATAGGLTNNDIDSALMQITQLAGIDNIEIAVKAFIEGRFQLTKVKILKWVGSFPIQVDTSVFRPQKRFVKKTNEINFLEIGECFTRRFLLNAKKIQIPAEAQRLNYKDLLLNSSTVTIDLSPKKVKKPSISRKLKCMELLLDSLDTVIVGDFCGERITETALPDFFAFLREYKADHDNVFGSKHGALFYLRDTSEELCAVPVRWKETGWTIHAHSLDEGGAWSKGVRIFYPE